MSDADKAERGDKGQRESHGIVERLRTLLGLGPGSVRDDIEDALKGPDEDAEFTPQERAILKNVLGLHEVRVDDVMVPRADIVATPADTLLGELLAKFRNAGHSRLPVFGDTLDEPLGMIHIRDFVDFLASEPRFGLASEGTVGERRAIAPGIEVGMDMPLSAVAILRPLLYVPPSMPALDLLLKMQTSRTHMALVIDEYGGTEGLVSIEDLVEAIVGEIEDEHDEAERSQVAANTDGTFLVEARAPLDKVSEAVGFDFSPLAEVEDVDTIGGLIAAHAGRVPARGEIISGPGEFEFEVVDADARRIKRIKIHPSSQPRGAPAAAEAAPDAARLSKA